MDAIAGQGLAIGFDLHRLVIELAAVLTIWVLGDGGKLVLKVKIPSFSLDLRVWRGPLKSPHPRKGREPRKIYIRSAYDA